jgi:glycosyltransferase involved in cell wall biosynthesis
VKIAFYAPLKAPTHPVPSGDRRIAQLLMRALEHAGHEVVLASRLRTFDGAGDARRQARLRDIGARVAVRAARRLARDPPACWLTYHLYHKAPDWVGPPAAARLGIPYLVAEAAYAAKQAAGPWSLGLEGTRRALSAARAVIALKRVDIAGVRSQLAADAELVSLAPFVDTDAIAGPCRRLQARDWLREHLGLDPDAPWLAAVAMMRPGDKTSSYRLLARALALVLDRRWQVVVVGDGSARTEVEAVLGALPRQRVRLAGAWARERLDRLLCGFDLLAWPGVGEAIGMALLEAGAAGVPVLAGRGGGVGDVVRDGETGCLVPAGDARAFADALARLLDAPGLRARLGAGARGAALADHSVPAAAVALDSLLRRVCAPGA